jgi:hypothetical protein
MKATTITRLVGTAAISSLVVLLPVAHAGAASYPNGGQSPEVSPETTQVSPATATKASTLPFTGADIAQLAALGAASAGAGTFVVLRSRRRRTA